MAREGSIGREEGVKGEGRREGERKRGREEERKRGREEEKKRGREEERKKKKERAHINIVFVVLLSHVNRHAARGTLVPTATPVGSCGATARMRTVTSCLNSAISTYQALSTTLRHCRRVLLSVRSFANGSQK